MGTRRFLPRARAWLLLGLFLGAGTTLPSLDALLFHWRIDPLAGRVHVEPAGGCGTHAEACALGRTPSGSSSATPFVAAVRVVPPTGLAVRGTPSAPALDPRATSLPRPRAPPAPPV